MTNPTEKIKETVNAKIRFVFPLLKEPVAINTAIDLTIQEMQKEWSAREKELEEQIGELMNDLNKAGLREKEILKIIDEWIPKKGTVAWKQRGYVEYWKVTDGMLNILKQKIKGEKLK